MAITTGCQSVNTGSIPVTRSKALTRRLFCFIMSVVIFILMEDQGIKTDRLVIPGGDGLLLPDQGALDLAPSVEMPRRVIDGFMKYLKLKGLISDPPSADQSDRVAAFLGDLGVVTQFKDFFKSNAFKYMTTSTDLDHVLDQILTNAQFWISRFGMDFFARHPKYSKQRGMFYKETIPGTGCYLSCKGGSGSGTFSVDLAIGVEKGQRFHISGEVWRLGLDTEQVEDGTAVRIVRCGSGMSPKKAGYDEKVQACGRFKKALKLHPSRALGLLAMYVAYDLGADSMKCLSLAGARDKRFTLIPASGVNYDYDAFAKGLGFRAKQGDMHWLHLPDLQDRFYDILVNRVALEPHEASGLDPVVDTFARLRDHGSPLTICGDESEEEIARVMEAFRLIHRQGEFFLS